MISARPLLDPERFSPSRIFSARQRLAAAIEVLGQPAAKWF
jgi:hypothetical protein